MKLLEYSVIYTNRSINLMSQIYKNSFKNLNYNLCNIYNARKTLLLPGSGSTAMESIARQFGLGKKCMIIRNGYFSYRWSQIFEHGKPFNISNDITVHKGIVNTSPNQTVTISPPPISQIIDSIKKEKPNLICVPHVETSSGILLPDDYINEIGQAAKKNDCIFCLDGIASGTLWIDMKKLNIDLYITAPQKGWSSPASSGVVMVGDRAYNKIKDTQSNSFILDLNRWLEVTEAYEEDQFKYHCTVPTDSIINFSQSVDETINFGLDKAKNNAIYMGKEMRKLLESNGFTSIADYRYKSPTVIVSQCKTNMVEHFKDKGIQVTGFSPFMLNEPDYVNTFRVGLFGLDKLSDPEKTIHNFKQAL